MESKNDPKKKNVFATLWATNHSEWEREQNDFYATDPIAIDLLFENESYF